MTTTEANGSSTTAVIRSASRLKPAEVARSTLFTRFGTLLRKGREQLLQSTRPLAMLGLPVSTQVGRGELSAQIGDHRATQSRRLPGRRNAEQRTKQNEQERHQAAAQPSDADTPPTNSTLEHLSDCEGKPTDDDEKQCFDKAADKRRRRYC